MLESLDRTRLTAAGLSFLIGFGLWALSPALLGVPEPWDSPVPLYVSGLLAGGAVLGFALGPVMAPSFLGAWLGQVLALLTLPISSVIGLHSGSPPVRSEPL